MTCMDTWTEVIFVGEMLVVWSWETGNWAKLLLDVACGGARSLLIIVQDSCFIILQLITSAFGLCFLHGRGLRQSTEIKWFGAGLRDSFCQLVIGLFPKTWGNSPHGDLSEILWRSWDLRANLPGVHGNSALNYGYGCLAQRLVQSWRRLWSVAAAAWAGSEDPFEKRLGCGVGFSTFFPACSRVF